MSGFKRMQSKVFWGQMAAQDIGERSPLIATISAASSIASLPNVYSNHGMIPSEESETSLRDDSDASDGNVTAIRVINEVVDERDQPDESPKVNKRMRDELADQAGEKSRSEDGSEGKMKLGNLFGCQAESSSFAISLCNRSLDSGFSDSNRSNSPEIQEGEDTPKRRRRRRKIVARGRPQLSRKVHDRLGCLWRESEKLPDPAHTSTPKAERHPKYLRANRRARTTDEITQRSNGHERDSGKQR